MMQGGCTVCHKGIAAWFENNAQGVAARHHDATGHKTWVEITLTILYGDEPEVWGLDVPLEQGSGGGNKQEIKGEPPPGHGAGGKSSAAQNAAAPAPGDEEGARINSARVRAARAPDDRPSPTFVPQLFSEGRSA